MISGVSLCFPLQLHACESGARLYGGFELKLFILVGWDRSVHVCFVGIQLLLFFILRFSVVLLSLATTQHVVSVKSSSLIHHGTFRDLFVLP